MHAVSHTYTTSAPRAPGKFLAFVAIALLCLCTSLSIDAAAQADVAIGSVPNADPHARGEIGITALDGTPTAKLKGLQSPRVVELMSGGQLLVVDPGRSEVLLVNGLNGTPGVSKSWKIPATITEPVGVHMSDDGTVTVFDRIWGAVRVNPDSSIAFESRPPAGLGPLSSSVDLRQQRYLVSKAEAEAKSPTLYLFSAVDRSWKPVSVGPTPSGAVVVPNATAGSGDDIFVWRVGQGTILRGVVRGEQFQSVTGYGAAAPMKVEGDGAQGLFQTTFDSVVRRVSPTGSIEELFQAFPPPVDFAFEPTIQRFAFAYQIPVSAAWPEEWHRWFPNTFSFDWTTFLLWTMSAVLVAVAWFLLSLRSFDGIAPKPSAETRWPHASWVLVFFVLALASSGLVLAAYGHALLLSDAAASAWLPSYASGAALVAAAIELWRRRSPLFDEPLRFSQVVAGTPPRVPLPYAIPLVGIACVTGYLLWMGTSKAFVGSREGVFCSGLILFGAVAVADAYRARQELRSFVREDACYLAVPLLVGIATFFYRLLDVPQHCHFDFTFNSFYASQFIDGKFFGAWEWGYVPAPIIGAIPEILGFLLAGQTPLGYRLGNPIFNYTAIIAVYLLGRVYRNRRVGMWAAIILAGNIPFMHFARLESNGSAATTALWALTSFALAIRYQRVSLWLFMGLACGFAFYQWPVARVGITSVALMYLFVLVRYPMTQIKRWYLPLAGVLGCGIMIAPLIPIWLASPHLFMPRAGESMTGVQWHGSWFTVLSDHPTVQLFYKSFGWIFSERDLSAQGTLSPGFNSFEAVLFACGLIALLVEGVSFNLLLLLLLMITLIVCGALAVGPPWYTRVLPTAPVVAIVAARALEGLHNISARGGRRLFWGSFVLLSAALVWISPIRNFRLYERYETGQLRHYPAHQMVTIGRHIQSVGPQYEYVFLARGEPEWQIKHQSAFAEMLPYIMNLRLKESYELESELPVPKGSSKAFLVQLKRESTDVPAIKRAHPQAVVETVRNINDEPVALLVRIDNP